MAEVFNFIVNDNRTITYRLSEPIMLEDNGVSDWRFHIPNIVNGLDATGWQWRLVYVNAKGEKYTIPLTLEYDYDRPDAYSIATYTVDYGMSCKVGNIKFSIEAIDTDTGGTILHEWHTKTYSATVEDTLQGNQVEYAETESDIISALLIEVRNKVNQLVGGATPLPVASVSEMTDTGKVYLLTTDANWYYHNGTAWVSGGVYGAGITDAIPTQGSTNAVSSGGVYDALTDITADLSAMTTATAEDVGKALKAKTVNGGKVTEWEFGEAGATSIIANGYKATSTYAVGDYCIYDNVLYKCTTAIKTAEAWNAEHWTAVTVSEELTQNNERLDMLVTLQEVEPEPVPENVQVVNPADILSKSGQNRIYVDKIDISRDGTYYPNPYNETHALVTTYFYNSYGEQLTFTDKNGKQLTSLSALITTTPSWFTIENHRVIKYFVRKGELSNTYTFISDVAYISSPNGVMYFTTSNANYNVGITYGDHFDEYVPYGDAPDVPTEYELAYNLDLARFVQSYMLTNGTAASNTMFNFFYPEKDNSEFVNAVKYYHDRAERQRNDVIRIGSFNKFVSRGKNNWSTIKQELADYSLDICGFQECAAIQSGGVVTTQIGEYLKGWQFKDYAVQDAVVDKALVSHWEVTQTDLITLLTYDNNAGTSNCIHALMTIPTNEWYSNVIDADATLSVYCYHGKSTGATIGGTSYSSYQVRQMEINALLAVIANDTADFIVIVGDTNAFETGFDIATGTHHEWEMFRNAGFTPVLDGTNSTVTANQQNKYFCKADNDKVYCIACYDQIFIGANITVEKYGVVDSNLYPVEALGNVPVSDHCMVYADLKFDFDAVMQAKLADIAVTTPWWS